MSDQLLSMFFDDEFVPHAYLDAFFSNGQKTTNLRSQSNIQSLQNNSSLLLSNLDFLTNELTNDLESKINKLYNSNSIISYSYQNKISDDAPKLKPTSRLEYYIDSLLISIQSLSEIIDSTTTKIESIKAKSDPNEISTVQKLINLSTAKINLLQVLKSFELLKSIIDISDDIPNISDITVGNTRTAPTSSTNHASNGKTKDRAITTTPAQFQASLNSLRDTILEQFNSKAQSEGNHAIDFEFLKKINSFTDLLPIFRNLTSFHNIYNEFVKKVLRAKQEYLDTKDLDFFDNNDELFKQVLT